jgi:hypothetical protein
MSWSYAELLALPASVYGVLVELLNEEADQRG